MKLWTSAAKTSHCSKFKLKKKKCFLRKNKITQILQDLLGLILILCRIGAIISWIVDVSFNFEYNISYVIPCIPASYGRRNDLIMEEAGYLLREIRLYTVIVEI